MCDSSKATALPGSYTALTVVLRVYAFLKGKSLLWTNTGSASKCQSVEAHLEF